MQQTVRLLDSLGERYGEEHTYQNLRSPADAIKLLCINRPAFEKELLEAHNNGVYYRVVQSGADMSYKDLQLPLGSKDLYIVPVIGGSGGGATTKILVGVGLVAASFLLPGAGLFGATSVFGASAVVAGTAGATATGVALTTLGTALSAAGAGLILSGVADVISPQPKLPSLGSNRMASGSAEVSRGVGPQNFTRAMSGGQSYAYTGGSENSVGIGATVPVAFGKVLIGSHLLSIDVETADESSALRTSVFKPGHETMTVNGKKLTESFEVAGGVRTRTWLQTQLDKSKIKTNSVNEKVQHLTGGDAKSITLRNSSTGAKELNSLTLTNTTYFRQKDKRENFMIFFELGKGLFDRVGDQPGSTRIPGFITYKITCTADDYQDEPVIAEIQATVQGILPMATASNGMKYRWCHALAFPRLVDPGDAEVRVRISIVDHDTHKRPTDFDQMDLKVRFTGYNLFNKKSQNETQRLIGL